MEIVATLTALFVGILALMRYLSSPTNLILLLGVGFLGAGFLDGYHSVVTSLFFSRMFPSPPEALIPCSWLASRLFLSGFFVWGFWAWKEEKKGTAGATLDRRFVFLVAGALTLVSFAFFSLAPLPTGYSSGDFLYRPADFLPGLMSIPVLYGFLKFGNWVDHALDQAMVFSLIITIVAQMFVMPRSASNFDAMFDAVHALKILSYLVIMIGLLFEWRTVFKQSEANTRAEEVANQRLVVANQDLSQYTHAVSHDLKAPLRAMHNYSDFLAEDLAGKLSGEQAEYLAGMRRAVIHTEELVEFFQNRSARKNFSVR